MDEIDINYMNQMSIEIKNLQLKKKNESVGSLLLIAHDVYTSMAICAHLCESDD